MGYQDREPQRQQEHEQAYANLLQFLLTDRTLLLSESDRQKLKGSIIPINYFKNTPVGLGIIQEGNFTILDGATFMWDEIHPAAVAYGLNLEEQTLMITGGVFYRGALRKHTVDAKEADYFPALVSEIPGYPNYFDHSVAFRITAQSPYLWHLTVGGRFPETRITTQIFGRNSNQQITNDLAHAVKTNIPRV